MGEKRTSAAKTQDCVLVLGMHRSGTSALAGVLSLLGCATPASLIRGDQNNEKGYFESNAIGRLSDSILEELGSAWNDWLPLALEDLPEDQQREFCDRARQTIEHDFADAPLFVLKEPRMCRMVPLWLKALQEADYRVHILHTHRNPLEVAASLARRDGFETAFSLLLWLRHVLDAESATRGLSRAFTSYRHLMQDWRAVVDTLGNTLSLELSSSETPDSAKAVEAFLSDRLQHFSDAAAETLSSPALSRNIRDMFGIMERWVETGEDEEDYATLDDIRLELDALSLAFAPLIRPGQMAMLALAESQTETASAQAQVLELQKALEVQTQKLDKANTDLAQNQTGILRLQNAIRDRERTLEEQARSLDRIRADLAEKQTEIRRLREAARDREHILQDQSQNLEQARADNAALHQNLAQAKDDYQALLQSTSWGNPPRK